jgi:hypothetical protein
MTAMSKPSRKWKIIRIAAILIFGWFAYRCLREIYPVPESEYAQHERFKQEARQAMMEECTNEVIGLNKIIKVDFMNFPSDIHDWRGEVTAEFVNDQDGGVERTNLSFRFALHQFGFGPQIWTNAGLDYVWMGEQHAERRREEFAAWEKRLHEDDVKIDPTPKKELSTLKEKLTGGFGWDFDEKIPADAKLSKDGEIKFDPTINVYREGFLFCNPDRTVFKIVACADDKYKPRVLADLKRRFGPGEDYDYGESCRWENDSQEVKLMRLDDGFAVVYTDKTAESSN